MALPLILRGNVVTFVLMLITPLTTSGTSYSLQTLESKSAQPYTNATQEPLFQSTSIQPLSQRMNSNSPHIHYIRETENHTTRETSTLVLLKSSANTHRASAETCFKAKGHNFSEVLTCYKKALTSQPLDYTLTEIQYLPGNVEKRSYDLVSQTWSPEGLVKPKQWKHKVDIYIPLNPLVGQALLVANNGTNHANNNESKKEATDFSENTLLKTATQTRTIAISVSNIPNQYLTYKDGIARDEDDSVAHSWNLFLKNPEKRPFMPLQIPMMGSMIQAMNLAQKELKPWKIDQFIASGVSKRGWSTWLAAIADKRIRAIVPFVIDTLNTKKVLEHTYRTYGETWPPAFTPYQREGITEQLQNKKLKNFAKLLQIIDPFRYLKNAAKQLSIPKYIVNASNDDFFPPDNIRLYFDQLPGQKALRITPNSSHHGIREFIEGSLISFINRVQQGHSLPTIQAQLQNQKDKDTFSLNFSETPLKVTQWSATNPAARDFRYYSSDIRYQQKEIPIENQHLQITINQPEKGWNATFFEVSFPDGFVITTPVYVTPETYPISIARVNKNR